MPAGPPVRFQDLAEACDAVHRALQMEKFRKSNELIDDETPFFIHFTGSNKHALPFRTKEGLNFNIEHGEFHTTWHEANTDL